jgi:hypothetical protein
MATRPRSSASPAASRDAVPASGQLPAGLDPGTPSVASAPPAGLKFAAAAQAAEAAVLFVAAIFAAVATFTGKSYERSSGLALTLIAVGTAAGFAAFAVGLFRMRPWVRTPVVMAQLFVGGVGIYLLDGHRFGWAIPALALAIVCLAGVFLPASVRALNRPPMAAPDPQTQPARAQPAGAQPTRAQQTKAQQAKAQQAKAQRSTRPSQNTKHPPANRKRKPRR